MKRLLFAALLLSSCAAVPVKSKVIPPEAKSYFDVNTKMESSFQILEKFIFGKNYVVKSQLKGDQRSAIRVTMIDAPVSYIDKKSKIIKDTSAIAITEVRQRINNWDYVYPVAGTFDCLFELNMQSNGLVQVSIMIDKTCTITQYLENYYLEKRRKVPGIEIKSTGYLESSLKTFMTQ